LQNLYIRDINPYKTLIVSVAILQCVKFNKMNAIVLPLSQVEATPAGYILGALIFLFLLAYLIYSLVKPDKF